MKCNLAGQQQIPYNVSQKYVPMAVTGVERSKGKHSVYDKESAYRKKQEQGGSAPTICRKQSGRRPGRKLEQENGL